MPLANPFFSCIGNLLAIYTELIPVKLDGSLLHSIDVGVWVLLSVRQRPKSLSLERSSFQSEMKTNISIPKITIHFFLNNIHISVYTNNTLCNSNVENWHTDLVIQVFSFVYLWGDWAIQMNKQWVLFMDHRAKPVKDKGLLTSMCNFSFVYLK